MTTPTSTSQNTIQTTKSPTGITAITINRPALRNAIDGPTAQTLTAAFVAFEEDATQKVCVFAGAGGTFCSGFDLHEVAKFKNEAAASVFASAQSDEPEESKYNGPKMDADGSVEGRTKGPIGPSRMQVTKPVIAAVSGYAVAGGLELSLLADIRVAEEDAVFGVFCRRWGVPLIDGGTVRLQAIIGLGRALDMILTGRPVGAQEALGMGLANRVVPKGKAVEEAMGIARQLVEFPQGCMNADRASCYNAAFGAGGFEEKLAFEYEHGIGVLKEGVKGAGRFSSGAGRHGAFSNI